MTTENDIAVLARMLENGGDPRELASRILAAGFHRGEDATPVHEARLHRAYLRGLGAGLLKCSDVYPFKAELLL